MTGIAIIGGSGLYQLDALENSHAETVSTPYGEPSDALTIGSMQGESVVFLARHGAAHTIPPHRVNYRANLWALREAGADHVLAVYAVGGLHDPYAPAALAAPDQLIDYSWGREHTYSDSGEEPLVHVDFTRPFDGRLRRALLAVARDCAIELVDGGCIGVFQGPRLESAAEIKRARRDGCDMAGMTALPEAGLARELGLDYAGLAVVSNWGAGVSDDLLSEEDIAQTLREPMTRVRRMIAALAPRLLAREASKND